MVWHRVVRGMVWQGVAWVKGDWQKGKILWWCVCGIAWLCLVVARVVACVCWWQALWERFVKCGGGMAWVQLKVDMDGGGGGEGEGSRMKGKEEAGIMVG